MRGKQSVSLLHAPAEVECGAETTIRTELGTFRFLGFRDARGHEHLAVVKGELGSEGVLCRLHSECLTGEVFGSRRCECGPQLDLALKRIERLGSGVVIYLRQEGRGLGLINKLKAYQLQSTGADTLEANERLGFAGDLRCYDVAAAILRALGVRSVVLMSNNPDKRRQIEHFGIEVKRMVPHVTGVHDDNRGYMRAKRARMGHLLPV